MPYVYMMSYKAAKMMKIFSMRFDAPTAPSNHHQRYPIGTVTEFWLAVELRDHSLPRLRAPGTVRQQRGSSDYRARALKFGWV